MQSLGWFSPNPYHRLNQTIRENCSCIKEKAEVDPIEETCICCKKNKIDKKIDDNLCPKCANKGYDLMSYDVDY